MFEARNIGNIPVIELTDNDGHALLKRTSLANSPLMNVGDCVSISGCKPICTGIKSAMVGQSVSVCHYAKLPPTVVWPATGAGYAHTSLAHDVVRLDARAMGDKYLRPISNRIPTRIPI